MTLTKSRAQMKARKNILFFVILLPALLVLVHKLYELQIQDGEKYKSMALKQQLRPTSISASRGTIYDRNMKTLAASATVWNVVLSPADIKSDQLNMIVDFLSKTLDVSSEKITKLASDKTRYYEVVKNKVEKDVCDEINKFIADNSIKGINLIEDNKRYYPYGNLASTIIGFTGDGNKGAYGLEAYYEKTLAGTPGKIISAKNSKGGEMPSSYQQIFSPQEGNSVVLTIDEVVQHFLEKHLEIAVVEHNVNNRAAGIVLNIKTGEVLAMASKPDFDPNNPREITDPRKVAQLQQIKADNPEKPEVYTKALEQAQFDQWRNKAISDPYEPGSVAKVLTTAMALDTNLVPATGQYFSCPGYHIVAGRRKNCWKLSGHGSIDFTHAVKYSCNPAFMMIGAILGPNVYDTYFERFGLKELTGIDIPGEAESLYHSMKILSKPSGEELASSAFGQTFKVTPIQLITAVASSINGNLMRPYVVKQILDSEGNVISTTQPQVKRKVVSEETANELALIMERVVKDSDASGRYAYVPGYRVGGKTGTSQKLDRRSEDGTKYYIGSFLGISPANDPQIAVLVLLDEPMMQNTYGSVIAAPVVGAVLADTLSYLGIEPQYTQEEIDRIDVKVPYLIGSLVHDATTSLTTKGLKYRIIGTGIRVTSQVPAASQSMPKDGTVIIYTDEQSEASIIPVPDIIGLSAQQANRTILNMGFNIRIEGMGISEQGAIAIKQDPEPGKEVKVGSVVTVEFGINEPPLTEESSVPEE